MKNAELVKSKRFNASELSEIRNIIVENIELFKTKWRFIGDGEGIHWEDLNEDILVEGLL